jgi:hypothetical protein
MAIFTFALIDGLLFHAMYAIMLWTKIIQLVFCFSTQSFDNSYRIAIFPPLLTSE